MVLRDADAVVVHQAEAGLGVGKTLFCGEAVPLHGLGVVLRDADAVVVHVAEADLGAGKTLFCGEAVPLGGLGVVLEDAVAVVVHHAEAGLGRSIALLGQRSPFFQRVRVVAAIVGVQAILEVRPGGPDDQHQQHGAETFHGRSPG